MSEIEYTFRAAARAVILDPADRVLLVWGCDPARPDAGQWWYTPGGGIEEGESAAQAVRRELYEEIRLTVDEVGSAIFEETNDFEFDGHLLRQHNTFFMVRVSDTFEPDLSELSAYERSSLLSVEWLTVDELRSSPYAVYPTNLAELIASLISAEPAGR